MQRAWPGTGVVPLDAGRSRRDRSPREPGCERTADMSADEDLGGHDRPVRHQPVPLHGAAQRLTIHVDETVQHRHHPLYVEIVHRAHSHGMAGATVLRGVEGYGASNHIHTTRMLSLSEDLPVLVVIIDSHERIALFLQDIEPILGDGLIVLENVEVVFYSGRPPTDPDPERSTHGTQPG
jgi:uncharacterized protein